MSQRAKKKILQKVNLQNFFKKHQLTFRIQSHDIMGRLGPLKQRKVQKACQNHSK